MTRARLLGDAVRARAVDVLDGSIEANKDSNPFLHGVPAILEALREPGLTKNIELNIQVQSAREVAQLQEWFETH